MQDDNQARAQRHFETAVSLQSQGQSGGAETSCRDALNAEPDHREALKLLAAILTDSGRLAEAERSYRRLAALTPTDAALHCRLGQIQYRLGRQADALTSLQRSLSLKPDAPVTRIALGNVFETLNRPFDALVCYRDAQALDPSMAEPYNRAGVVLAAIGRHADAVSVFERAVEHAPDSAAVLTNMGDALGAVGRIDEAVSCFERALALEPTLVPARFNLGKALTTMERHEEAVTQFQRVFDEQPDYPDALFSLAKSLFAALRAAEALEAFERLAATEPRLAAVGAGHALKALGRLDEALAAYERAVALAPASPSLHLAISDLRHFGEDDPQTAAMEALLPDAARFNDAERVALHFALAKAYEDVGRYQQAFEQLRAGNAHKRRMLAYDETAVLGQLRNMENVFTADLIAQRRGHGNPSELPVFVVGMPRSGTTLVEQLLASHPRAFGAGERRYWLDLLEQGRAGERFPFGFAALPEEDLRRLGSLYAERLKAHAPQAERIVDKLPANFRLIGLIHLALPKARIIHIRRDPMDTCFSCYAKLFINSLEYSCDLGELGRYYRAYEGLMAHWRRVLPEGAMLEVQYEELVSDFEAQARRIVGYCGLDWDARCLSFHSTERPVHTASAAQVRRPLFQSSVGRWKPYAEWLAPLREALGAEAG
ncbi:MAG: sulfotransferase [Alphaproteobacteria bacterium]|nr:sulfotransferase [Alphaproteobacteria bacterium]MDE2112176.1 sulfotransferase [Alphaproteobacteria bacterium]MDE2495807.1 sulfotransferase [Alphaproteobacteria bacterium]